ncbi:MAG: SDR family NAD(P)-dependent oxidoreductase [Aliidongia sp.]
MLRRVWAPRSSRAIAIGAIASSPRRAPSKDSNDPNILVVPGDIADPRTAERVISQAVARFGRIDTLVNNAGIFIAKPFTDLYR